MENKPPSPSKGYQKQIKTIPASQPSPAKKVQHDYASPAAKKWPLLKEALESGNVEGVKKFIEEGLNINIMHGDVTPLMMAASKGFTEIAEALIQAGANINYKNDEGWTALHKAAFDQTTTGVVDLFLQSGVDFEARNKAGKTPLNLAEEKGHRDIARQIKTHQERAKADAQEWEHFLDTPDGKPYKRKRLSEAMETYSKFMWLAPLLMGGAAFFLGFFFNIAANAGILGAVFGLLMMGVYYAVAWILRAYLADYAPIPYLDINLLREKRKAGEKITLKKRDKKTVVEEKSEERSYVPGPAISAQSPPVDQEDDIAQARGRVSRQKNYSKFYGYAILALVLCFLMGSLIIYRGPLTRWYYVKKVEMSGVPFSDKAFLDEVSKNSVKTVGLFIKAGIPADAVNEKGQTALMIAADKGNETILTMLIKQAPGAIKHVDKGGNTALMTAVRQGREAIVHVLVEHGAEVNYTASTIEGAASALQAALDVPDFNKEQMNIMRYLLEHGADVKGRNASGQFPLLFAADHGQTDAAGVLIEHGADVNDADAKGTFPLLSAACRGHSGFVALLMDKGANVKMATTDGQSSLQCAAREGRGDTVKVLLERGAAVNAKAKNGFTALAEAAKTGNVDLVRLLLEHGADPGNSYLPDSLMRLNGKSVVIKATKIKIGDVLGRLARTAAQDGYIINFDPNRNQKTTVKASGPWNKVLYELATRNHLFLVLKEKTVFVMPYDPAAVDQKAI